MESPGYDPMLEKIYDVCFSLRGEVSTINAKMENLVTRPEFYRVMARHNETAHAEMLNVEDDSDMKMAQGIVAASKRMNLSHVVKLVATVLGALAAAAGLVYASFQAGQTGIK